MWRLSHRLLEDLNQYFPKPDETPGKFAFNPIRQNPTMWDLLADMPLPDLNGIETPNELISWQYQVKPERKPVEACITAVNLGGTAQTKLTCLGQADISAAVRSCCD